MTTKNIYKSDFAVYTEEDGSRAIYDIAAGDKASGKARLLVTIAAGPESQLLLSAFMYPVARHGGTVIDGDSGTVLVGLMSGLTPDLILP